MPEPASPPTLTKVCLDKDQSDLGKVVSVVKDRRDKIEMKSVHRD